MKKHRILFITVSLLLSLSACGSGSKAGAADSVIQKNGGGSGQNSSGSRQSKDGGSSGLNGGSSTKSGEPVFLCSPDLDSACSTQSGYYYLAEETVKLRDGNYGSHLMYMDYASCREIYLCSTAGCKHDSADCPAVFLYDDFTPSTTKLFVFQDHLYLLSREPDNDGSMSSGGIQIGGDAQAESKPAVLYQANLDGTQRKKIYTFDSALTLEDLVLGDADGIYVITKKVAVDTEGSVSYTTSSERRLVHLDMKSLELKEICPLTFNDNITWQVIGCSGSSLVLSGMDYGRKLSREEMWNDDDIYKELWEHAADVYAILDLGSGQLKEICRQSNQGGYFHSARVIGGCLYLSSSENQNIESLNLATGERKTVCSLPQNQILGSIGEEVLCCRDWDLSKDFTYYFVNIGTGEVNHGTLVNQCNGWDLEFCAETQTDVLTIYDYDAVKNSDESYEIHQYKYALIAKEDLFAGRENYRKIDMIGPGK